MREIKEDPGEAESADAEEGDEGRRRGDAVSAQGVGENFQKDVDALGKHHIPDADNAKPDHLGVGAEEPDDGAGETKTEDGHDGHAAEIEKNTGTGAEAAAAEIPGAVVLAHEGGDGLTERGDDAVYVDFNGESCRAGSHGVGAEAVNRLLQAYVGYGENHELHAGGQADAQDFLQVAHVSAHARKNKAYGSGRPDEAYEEEDCGPVVGNIRRPDDAAEAPSCFHEGQVEHNVENGGLDEGKKGRTRVAAASQDGCGEIEEGQGRDAIEIDPEVVL